MLYNKQIGTPLSDTAYTIMMVFVILLIFFLLFITVRIFQIMIKERNEKYTYRDDTDGAEINKIHVTVLKMNCTVKAVGRPIPETIKVFYVTFLMDDGKKVSYSVDEDSYLLMDENQKGTLKTVNGEFYEYRPD